jgi:hypothetical protein
MILTAASRPAFVHDVAHYAEDWIMPHGREERWISED